METEQQPNTLGSLSHDLGATFMLLESSLSQLRKSLAEVSSDPSLQCRMDGQMAHVDACLEQSKLFVDDLGCLARGDQLEMTPTRVEPAAVIDQVLFEQNDLLYGRNIRVEISRPLPIVWCNESRLKQIITNLIRNAALHGCDPAQPQITITAIAPEPSESGDRLTGFRIHDNGPGIDQHRRDEVFLPGRRLDNSHSRGSGMGLAIVKDLAVHYKGKAYIDANCMQGTAFVVVFPKQPASGGAAEQNLSLDDRHPQRAPVHTTLIRRRRRT
jgi:signal transduction histidine kinase